NFLFSSFLVRFSHIRKLTCHVLTLRSVDTETESIMQDIIDKEFKECTVLAVMHRLGHIGRYDRVALFGEGRLLEFGEPGALIAENTQFGSLYRKQYEGKAV